jgi:hypothetical protein
MANALEYTKHELQGMADRENERDHRRLWSLGIDPEGDPIDIMLEVSRLYESLKGSRRREP